MKSFASGFGGLGMVGFGGHGMDGFGYISLIFSYIS